MVTGLNSMHTIYASSIYSQILCYICHCVDKKIKVNKKEAVFGPFKNMNSFKILFLVKA